MSFPSANSPAQQLFQAGRWAAALEALGEQQAEIVENQHFDFLDMAPLDFHKANELDTDFEASSGGRCTPVRDPLPEPLSSSSEEDVSSVHVR